MKSIRNIILGIAAASLLSSCGDFLEPKSTSEFVPKDANSLNELLLGNAYPRKDVQRLSVYLSVLDDDVTAAPYQAPNVGMNINKYTAAYTWQPDMNIIMREASLQSDIYYPHYQLILGCNAVLDYIGQVSDTPEKIDNVLAQAYALRGFLYFRLVNIFGQPYNGGRDGLGVPLKTSSGIETKEITRNTVGECYDRIVADLLEAERLYNVVAPYQDLWKPDARTSLPMVQLLLSRVYLYMEEWDKAAEYARKVMDYTQFRLFDLNTVSLTNSRGFPTNVDMHSYETTGECIWLYGNLNDMIEWVYSYTSGQRQHPFFAASDELMASFGEGDLRKDLYVARAQWRNNGEYMPCAYGKFTMRDDYNFFMPVSGDFTFSRSFRISEAYLNYAEAAAEMWKSGNASVGAAAVAALNELRRNRIARADYAEVSFSGADSMLDFVREERRRELCFEDHRWFDLRRWGMPEIRHRWYPDPATTMEYVLQAGDPSYTCPLPEEALEANTALVQAPLGQVPRIGNQL